MEKTARIIDLTEVFDVDILYLKLPDNVSFEPGLDGDDFMENKMTLKIEKDGHEQRSIL